MGKQIPSEDDIESALIDSDTVYSMRQHQYYIEKHIEPIKIMLFMTVICTICIFIWMLLPLISSIGQNPMETNGYIMYDYDFDFENI